MDPASLPMCWLALREMGGLGFRRQGGVDAEQVGGLPLEGLRSLERSHSPLTGPVDGHPQDQGQLDVPEEGPILVDPP